MVCNQIFSCHSSFYLLRNQNLWIVFPNRGP